MIRKTSGSHPFTKWAVLILTLLAGLTLSSVRALAQEDPWQQRGRRGPLHPIDRLPRLALPARDPDLIPIGPVRPPHKRPKPPEQFIMAAPRSGGLGTSEFVAINTTSAMRASAMTKCAVTHQGLRSVCTTMPPTTACMRTSGNEATAGMRMSRSRRCSRTAEPADASVSSITSSANARC